MVRSVVELGRHEDVLARDAGITDGIADLLLILWRRMFILAVSDLEIRRSGVGKVYELYPSAVSK